MWRPRLLLSSVFELTPEWLQERGLRGLLLDLDNTLVPYGAWGDPPQELLTWLAGLKAAGLGLCLVSNALPERLNFWSKRLELPFVPAAKPWWGFRQGVRRLGLKPSEVAVVGDQLFTDVLGGNWAGCYTILVRPLSEQELGYTRLVRRLERWILR